MEIFSANRVIVQILESFGRSLAVDIFLGYLQYLRWPDYDTFNRSLSLVITQAIKLIFKNEGYLAGKSLECRKRKEKE
jgi:hypothetical protein